MKYLLEKLDKEDKKTLEKNMNHLKTSALSDYCLPVLQSEKIKLWSIYQKYISVNTPSISCPKCTIKVCSALYKLYEEMTKKK